MIEREISPLEIRVLEYIGVEIPELADHLIGTRDFALEINRDQSLGLDCEQIALAALCHDLARHHSPDRIVSELRSRGIDPDSFGYVKPILLHSILSAVLAREILEIEDEDVLRAIRSHATGCEEMALLDKLIYVADKVESTRDYPGIDALRALVREDLTDAFPRVVGAVINYVVAELEPLDYNSVAAYNQALVDLGIDVDHRQ